MLQRLCAFVVLIVLVLFTIVGIFATMCFNMPSAVWQYIKEKEQKEAV